MHKEIADKWVAALRSGQYTQGKGCLFDGKNHCCLGVLEAEMGSVFVKRGRPSEYYVEGTERRASLTPQTREAAGMVDSLGANRSGEITCLSELNDFYNWNFTQIADYVETNYQDL